MNRDSLPRQQRVGLLEAGNQKLRSGYVHKFYKLIAFFCVFSMWVAGVQTPTARAVIGGSPDLVSNWYVVSLTIGNFHCSGSLIDAKWVLTAAHCVVDENGNSFDIGGAAARAVNPNTGQILWESGISSGTYHPEYNSSTFHNDIAILSLVDSIPGPYATIASEAELSAVEAFGASAIASGFGRTSNYNQYSKSYTPLEVRIPLVDPPSCQKTWPYRQTAYFSKLICTKTTTLSTTCQGDSGGPLFVEVGGTRKLTGVTSFGSYPLCGSSYSIFTRLPAYLDWMNGVIKPGPSLGVGQPSPVVEFPNLPPLPASELESPPAALPGVSVRPLPEFSTTRIFQLTLEDQGRYCAIDIDAPISLRGRSLRIFIEKTSGRPVARRILDEFGDARFRVLKVCSKVPYKRIYVQLDDSTIKVRTVL
jgi:hypothetical protein